MEKITEIPMHIYRLPAFSDNYIFVLHDAQRKVAAVVDPADPTPVLRKLEELEASLVTIFNTHHHSDHVGGNRRLQQAFPDVAVYGGEKDRGRIPGQQFFLKDGDQIEFCDRIAQVFFVPGHTRAHIAYYFPASQDEPGDLFCGDTLFAGGCGRLFEGTPAQMLDSLSKLRNLPDDTRVWCAHEYTLKNLQFALTVDRENLELQERFRQVQQAREQDHATIPSSIGIENQTNPFLRWDQDALIRAVQGRDAVQTLARLRDMKDQF